MGNVFRIINYDGDVKTYKYLTDCIDLFTDLNDEVEIIEEPKKIEKIKMYQDGEGHYFLNKQMVDKFNELIDEINNLK